jgi:hypothetical protein
MTPSQLHILQHSLGCDQYGRADRIYRDEGDGAFGHYRNRYVSDPDSDLTALIEMGYLADHGAYDVAGGMHYYRVTKEGLAKMRELSPKPSKISRGRQRYLDFLSEDGSLTFGEWLKVRTGRVTA